MLGAPDPSATGMLTPTQKTAKLTQTFNSALERTLEKEKNKEASRRESKKKRLLELQMNKFNPGMASVGPEIKKVFDAKHRDLPGPTTAAARLM